MVNIYHWSGTYIRQNIHVWNEHIILHLILTTCSIGGEDNLKGLRNCYTMGCPPVRGDNPRALASGLSYVQVDKHGITILYHLHQCRPCTLSDISC